MAQDVQRILRENNVSYRVIQLKDRAITVQDVIKYSEAEINPAEICKTIIVKTKKQYVALFLRGEDKIDFKKLRGEFGKTRIASADDVHEITGVDPGAVCPLLLDIPVLVDNRVFELSMINFGSGDHMFGVEIASSDLEKVLDFSVLDFASG